VGIMWMVVTMTEAIVSGSVRNCGKRFRWTQR